MRYALYLFLALGSAATFASEIDFGDITEAYSYCSSKAKSNSDLKQCASDAYAEADRGLNVIYRELRQSIQRGSRVNQELARQAEIVKRMVNAQRAWIQLRDTDCEFKAANALGGTMESLLLLDCKFEATKARALDLQNLIGTF